MLCIGASRGLGLSLVNHYAELGRDTIATVRSEAKPGQFPSGTQVIEGIDVSIENAAATLVKKLKGQKLGVVIFVSGILKPESFEEPNWEDEILMYKICAMAPLFLIIALAKASLLATGAKIVILSSEAGSLTLRTESEGGGMYGHHASKAASNMIGRLLSFDLKQHNMMIATIHPGFLKTEMTKKAGMSEMYEQGGAITPEEACPGIVKFIDDLKLEDTGKFWAPNGTKGIGGWEEVMGANKEGATELPW